MKLVFLLALLGIVILTIWTMVLGHSVFDKQDPLFEKRHKKYARWLFWTIENITKK